MGNAALLITVPGRARLASPLVRLLHWRLKPHLDQMQHVPVNDPARHRLEKFGVWNGVEIRGQIRVNDVRVAGVEQAVHLLDRGERVALGPIAVLLGGQVGFEDRL